MKEKPIARRHHYLPQGYLAAFTSSGLKEDKFFVLDVNSGQAFQTSPLNVASRRDFNRVEIDGHPPDVLENALAPFEGEAVDAIRGVIENQRFPNDVDWNLILNLLGLIAVRNPKFRGSFNRSREQMLRRMAEILVSDKKIWDRHLEKARDAGENMPDGVSFEDARQFVEEGKYDFEFLPEGNLRVEFKTFDQLLPLLGQRTWSILVAPPEGPEFICSDHPVSLAWKGNRSGPIGFGLRETEVFFPLGRHVGFYGVFENPLKPTVICKPGNIATMNRRIAWNAERHVYSAQEYFCVWHEGRIREVQCVVPETR
ncbi:DUF4238 domain-containing protein [Methylomagnum ishizawai]|uniref:DUF4238 domain-containing protein n=1 Tax=Methylomagnum ishizawai TaxID=1760988 RepID=UPI001C320854|nr:DUF4238 domain-containing protein [Methylomagnum ishizawai]BBL76068.1 hypothetical protein MishRS11D_31660 [Methylomagnum ishizawai]